MVPRSLPIVLGYIPWIGLWHPGGKRWTQFLGNNLYVHYRLRRLSPADLTGPYRKSGWPFYNCHDNFSGQPATHPDECSPFTPFETSQSVATGIFCL